MPPPLEPTFHPKFKPNSFYFCPVEIYYQRGSTAKLPARFNGHTVSNRRRYLSSSVVEQNCKKLNQKYQNKQDLSLWYKLHFL